MNTLMLAELDPVQISIVVIAMIGGFVQWLWSLLQQGKKEAEERRAAPDPEEKKLREEAWRRQTQGQASPRPSPPPLKPVMNDPFATVKDIFEQIKRDAMESQRPAAPAAPPPLPPAQARPPKRHAVRAESNSPAIVRSPKPNSGSAELASTNDTVPVVLPISPPESFPTPQAATSAAPAWAGLLGSPAALRQAFILREILGPPKALQTAGDSPV